MKILNNVGEIHLYKDAENIDEIVSSIEEQGYIVRYDKENIYGDEVIYQILEPV